MNLREHMEYDPYLGRITENSVQQQQQEAQKQQQEQQQEQQSE